MMLLSAIFFQFEMDSPLLVADYCQTYMVYWVVATRETLDDDDENDGARPTYILAS